MLTRPAPGRSDRLQQPLALDEPGHELDQIAAPDRLTGPAPADDSSTNNPLYAGQFPSVSTIGPAKSDPNTVYAGTDNGRLWRTSTLGNSWQQFPNPSRRHPPAG